MTIINLNLYCGNLHFARVNDFLKRSGFFCPPSRGLFLRYIRKMKQPHALLIFLVGGLLLPPMALAVIVPQPIGTYIEKVGELTVNDDLVVDSSALLAHERRVQAVLELQTRLGAYDASLSQQWLELAHDAVVLSQPEAAAGFFQKGLHNLRLNAGLTTEKQITALSDWISVLRRLGDLESLGEQLQYRYRITGFGVSDWNEESLGYALEFFDNELAQLATTDWLANESKVIRFERHLDDVIERSCEGERASAIWCGPLVKRRLHLLYLIAFAVEPFVEDRQVRDSLPSKFLSDRSLFDEQLLALERNAYQSGVRMLEKAIAMEEGQFDLELALADWRWYFGRRGAAKDAFRELYAAHPQLFVVAQALPHGLIGPVTSRAEQDTTASTYRFTVNTQGNVRDLSLRTGAGEGEGEGSDPNRVRKALREIRFRPLLDGEGEVTESVVVGRYRYLR